MYNYVVTSVLYPETLEIQFGLQENIFMLN